MTQLQTRELLEILTEDARTTPETAAQLLGVSAQEAAQEIRRLEKEQILLKYSVIINEEKTEESEYVHALIEVSVAPQFRSGYEDIAGSLCRYPEVRSCYLMSGTYDYLLEVHGKTLRDVARFVAEKLAVKEGVTGTTTHFVLRKYKDKNVIMPFDEGDGRQVVTP